MVSLVLGFELVATYLNWHHVRVQLPVNCNLERHLKVFDSFECWVSFEVWCQAEGIGMHQRIRMTCGGVNSPPHCPQNIGPITVKNNRDEVRNNLV